MLLQESVMDFKWRFMCFQQIVPLQHSQQQQQQGQLQLSMSKRILAPAKNYLTSKAIQYYGSGRLLLKKHNSAASYNFSTLNRPSKCSNRHYKHLGPKLLNKSIYLYSNNYNLNVQLNRQIIQKGKSSKSSQEMVQFYSQKHRFFNLVNYCTFLKYLTKFGIKEQNKVQQIRIQCHKFILDRFNELANRTFCVYLQVLNQQQAMRNDQKQQFLDESRINKITHFIINKFELFNIEESSKSLRYYKKVLSKQRWQQQWDKISSKLHFSKFLRSNQQGGINKLFGQFEGSLNQILYLYDSLSDRSAQKQQNLTAQQKNVRSKINSALQALSEKVEERLQFSDNPYELSAMLLFLKKFIDHSSTQYMENMINSVLLDLKNKQRVSINSNTDLVSMLEIVKLSKDDSILVNNSHVIELLQKYIKSHKIIYQPKRDLGKSSLGEDYFDEQRQLLLNLVEPQQNYIVDGLTCAQVNIILNFYTHYRCWNSQIFEILQQTFFYLLYSDQSKGKQVNARNVAIYCKQRSKLGMNLLNKLIKSEHQQQKLTESSASMSLRIQSIKKFHVKFVQKIADHLQTHPRDYKQNGIKNILKQCQAFHVQSRRLKKKIDKVLEQSEKQNKSQE